MPETVKSSLPTRKWFAQQVTVIGGWVVALINAGWHVTPALQVTAAGIVTAAVMSYLVPNVNTPAGVPRKATRRS